MNKNDSLLVIAFILGIFGLVIWGLVKFTQNTIGKNSPLKVTRSYEVTKLRYFTKFDNLTIYYFALIGLYCLIKIPDIFSPSVYLYDWRSPAILIFTCIIFIGFPAYYLYLDLNYWKHTKNIRITYLPAEKTIEIKFPKITYHIQEGDIKNIEIISSGGKIQFGYSIYSLQNGDSFILTNRVPGTGAIREYFKNTPVKFIEKRFPLIK